MTTVLAVTIMEAASIAGLSRSTIYLEIQTGRLRAFKVGRSTRIKIADLQKWIDEQPLVQPRAMPGSPPAGPGQPASAAQRARAA